MPAKSRKKRRRSSRLLRRLHKHFRCDPATLPVVEQHVGLHDRPNLHLAIQELLNSPDRQSELLGIQAEDEHRSPSLGRLSGAGSARYFEQGSVEYVDVPLPGGRNLACVKRFARVLEPATVVLEDVDLIGTERDEQEIGANALLFELLNQMDGLADDVDILFVLTTNRPDVLEPALAARPGRVDQAIEIPPPDADCRRRLFELYSRGMHVEVGDWPRLIERTAGVSGAFIRELLRKAAVYASEEDGGDPLVVRDRHLEEAIAELLVAGGPLTKSLLGAK